jgi:hypothetical protein
MKPSIFFDASREHISRKTQKINVFVKTLKFGDGGLFSEMWTFLFQRSCFIQHTKQVLVKRKRENSVILAWRRDETRKVTSEEEHKVPEDMSESRPLPPLQQTQTN